VAYVARPEGPKLKTGVSPSRNRFLFATGCGSFQNLIFEGDASRIALLEPSFRGIRGGEDVLGVSDLLAGIDIGQHGHWSLFSLRLPQW